MTHFVCLVIGPDPDAQLRPFQEDTGSGDMDERYLVDVDRTDEVLTDFRDLGPKLAGTVNLEAFARSHYGIKLDVNGRAIERTNPNAEWDWYAIGGRWRGWLGADHGPRRLIDLEALRAVARAKARSEFGRAVQATRGLAMPPETFDELLERVGITEARRLWHGDPWVQAMGRAGYPFGMSGDDVAIMRAGEAAHVADQAASACSPWVWLQDGRWVDRDGDHEDWNALSDARWAALEPDDLVTVVDCHT